MLLIIELYIIFSENNIHDLRQSFIEKESDSDAKQTSLQNEIMSENKVRLSLRNFKLNRHLAIP